MNIEIVNKEVSKKIGLSEKKVSLINQFYWRKNYDHIYSYDSKGLNIKGICVFHVDKRLLKKAIKLYIRKIRFIKASKKYKAGSVKYNDYVQKMSRVLNNFLRMRKELKYTN